MPVTRVYDYNNGGGVVSIDGLSFNPGELKPYDAFGYVYSDTVELRFIKPVQVEHLFVRVNPSYLAMYREQHGLSSYPDSFIETYA